MVFLQQCKFLHGTARFVSFSVQARTSQDPHVPGVGLDQSVETAVTTKSQAAHAIVGAESMVCHYVGLCPKGASRLPVDHDSCIDPSGLLCTPSPWGNVEIETV